MIFYFPLRKEAEVTDACLSVLFIKMDIQVFV